jgi:hypothetical protein
MKRIDLIVGLLFLAALLGATLASADPLDTRSFYDRNGGFAGSSSSHQNTTSYSDRDGRFNGSAIRNSDGTTSLYDARGHFTGSVVNTSPNGGRDGRR